MVVERKYWSACAAVTVGLQAICLAIEIYWGFAAPFNPGLVLSFGLTAIVFTPLALSEILIRKRIGQFTFCGMASLSMLCLILIIGFGLSLRANLETNVVKRAIQEYHQKNGKYPETLGNLVPGYLAIMPTKTSSRKKLGFVAYAFVGDTKTHCIVFNTFPGNHNRYCFESDETVIFDL